MTKYAEMPEVVLNDRKWPASRLKNNPLWCAVDLRDGNQALPNPMTPEQKKEYFKLLTDIGFKEIEIGFPAASEDDFNFCRQLIEENLIPEDVTISVLTQSRSHLISRTIEALKGAKKAVIHAYIATSELHMKYVFGMEKKTVIETAISAANQIVKETEVLKADGTDIGFEFSPEEFSDTDIDFAIEICEKVTEIWGIDNKNKIILNLPMTVERRMPNEYADMIEYFCNNFKYRSSSVVSVHVHNDMGCAVAASMLALQAGADRVEGTLLGHGERTGNVDLITLALNLKYLGIETKLDFSNLSEIVGKVEEITDLPVSPRQPYSGQLVFTAFSGSHQDAINKGFIKKDQLKGRFGGWKIPYLHVDPGELGRAFEKFIRINSQSGKGGIAFVMHKEYNVNMPRWVQIDFAKKVQNYADRVQRELGAEELWAVFDQSYVHIENGIKLVNYWPRPKSINPEIIEAEVEIVHNGHNKVLTAEGNGPISALVNALRTDEDIPDFKLDDYFEDSMGSSAEAEALCFVKILSSDEKIHIGGGIHPNVILAASKAVINGVNRLMIS